MCQDSLYTWTCARTHALLLQALLPPFTTTNKGPSFLDRPILPSEKPVTLCVSKDKQSHRLVGTSETFYESHSPHLVTVSSARRTHPHPPSSLSLVCSVLRSFLLCVFFFKRCATSLPDIELPSSSIASRLPLGSAGTNITARLKRKQQYHEIHGSPPHQISIPRASLPRIQRGSAHLTACGPPSRSPCQPHSAAQQRQSKADQPGCSSRWGD